MSELQQRLERALATEQMVARATQLTGEAAGAKLLRFPDGEQLGTLGPALDGLVAEALDEMMRAATGDAARSEAFEAEGKPAPVRLFLEVFAPPPELILFGGVHIAIPLADFARTLGFRVILIDPRTTFANPERFPHVDRIIAEWPEEAMAEVTVTPTSYVAILTHDPKLDEPALKSVVGRGAAYIGAIGSRATHVERFDRMAKHGISAAALREVYAPIGLDLNAVTPEEIALAIIAEIVAVRRGGSGKSLRGQRTETGDGRRETGDRIT